MSRRLLWVPYWTFLRHREPLCMVHVLYWNLLFYDIFQAHLICFWLDFESRWKTCSDARFSYIPIMDFILFEGFWHTSIWIIGKVKIIVTFYINHPQELTILHPPGLSQKKGYKIIVLLKSQWRVRRMSFSSNFVNEYSSLSVCDLVS